MVGRERGMMWWAKPCAVLIPAVANRRQTDNRTSPLSLDVQGGKPEGQDGFNRVRNGKGKRRLTVIVIRWDGDCCVFDTWCVVVLSYGHGQQEGRITARAGGMTSAGQCGTETKRTAAARQSPT